MERIGPDLGSAVRITADRTQVMQAFQVAALALPVANGVIDKLELAQTTEIGDRENRTENALQSAVFTFLGEQVHLQEALIRTFLHFDEVRNRNRSLDLRKVNSLARRTV